MTDGFEDELRELGRRLQVPEPPDVAAAVRTRLAEDGPRGRRRWPYAVAAFLLTALLVGATPTGRAAVERVLTFAGVEIRVGSVPTPTRTAFTQETRLTLAQAQRRVGFPLLVPSALGDPDGVLLRDGGRVATLVWDEGVRLEEFDGRLDLMYFRKYISGAAGKSRAVQISGGREGVWISGPHQLVYLDRAGREQRDTVRTSGNVLLWQSGPVLLRLEGGADLAAARKIADSVPR